MMNMVIKLINDDKTVALKLATREELAYIKNNIKNQ